MLVKELQRELEQTKALLRVYQSSPNNKTYEGYASFVFSSIFVVSQFGRIYWKHQKGSKEEIKTK